MFQTEVKLVPSSNHISLDDQILAVGSCFAAHMGDMLSKYKFKVQTNPFGTLFNPMSIFKLVNQSALDDIFESMGIVKTQGVFHHFDLHSDLSNVNKGDLLDNANKITRELGDYLQSASVIIYTFGTAIVYELLESGEIVANCHKVPAKEFRRRMLEVDEIVHAFKVNFDLIKSINKNVRFMLTVSPVRHQKESFEQNCVSKSILRLATHNIVSEFRNVEYFPAFEIMMDELRDYRFYAEDMLHPNQVAIDHIWKRFGEVYFNNGTKDFINNWSKIRKAMAHRPFNPSSDQHQNFIRKTIEQLNEFSGKVDISKELKLLKSQQI